MEVCIDLSRKFRRGKYVIHYDILVDLEEAMQKHPEVIGMVNDVEEKTTSKKKKKKAKKQNPIQTPEDLSRADKIRLLPIEYVTHIEGLSQVREVDNEKVVEPLDWDSLTMRQKRHVFSQLGAIAMDYTTEWLSTVMPSRDEVRE